MNNISSNWYKYLITTSSLVIYNSFLAPLLAQHEPLQKYQGEIGRTLPESKLWWPEKAKPPKDSPNVLWILLDDVGFGASSAFGGLIETPNFETLANHGLRYTNFHNTGLCSPTRAALLTGRNHHKVGMGHHAEVAIGAPGYYGDMPFEAGTIAEIFRENGYNTFALGKWHGIKPDQQKASGPFNRWPTGRGFERFFGFPRGLEDQWHPCLYDGITEVNLEPNTNHLNKLLTDRAISYIANQKSTNPEKPFFLYFATGATHSPHQVSKEWSDKYKGKFDKGWDWYRQEVFYRQQLLKLLPKETVLPSRQAGIKSWESLTAKEKKVLARFMEVYAGFLSYTDYEIGRLIDFLKRSDLLDNTLIFLMIGDNGGSKSGTDIGSIGIQVPEKATADGEISFLLSQIDKIGTEYTNTEYPIGWGQATNTPFRYWKSDANSEGGTRSPLIIHWPNGIKEKGGIRTQYSHVIDILPTTVEITGVAIPDVINGYPQWPIQGTSLVYSLNDAKAPTRHTTQYYELHGGRAIYKDGWKAGVYHPRTLPKAELAELKDPHFNHRTFDQDKWELYNLNEDCNEINDVATVYPDKLKELQTLFDSEAKINNVYPLHNYMEGLAPPVIKVKTVILEGTSQNILVKLGHGPIIITVNIETSAKNNEGVIFANGGLYGGTSLYIKDGKLEYTINDGIKEKTITLSKSITVGRSIIKIIYTETNTLVVYFNGELVAEVINLARTRYLNSFSTLGNGISIGKDSHSPVTKTYPYPFFFQGRVTGIIIEQPLE